MAAFTQVSFPGKIGSKGRITIPVRIRNKLNWKKGDEVSLSIESGKVISKKVNSEKAALKFLSSLEKLESFSFDGEILEVVLNE